MSQNDVGELKEDVGTLKDDVGVLKKDVGVLKSDVALIRRALLGNNEWHEQGIMSRLEALEKWQARMVRKIAFYCGVATTIFFIGQKVFEYLTNSH